MGEDQLALAAGVAGVHHLCAVAVAQEVTDDAPLVGAAVLAGLQAEALGQHGEVVEAPAPPGRIVAGGLGQLCQVTQAPANPELLVAEPTLVPAMDAQHPRDVAGDAGFLGQDQTVGHGVCVQE
jgi:hypothetical protein